MAKQVTKDAIKKLDTKLECLICLDTFKQPKLLPCYHVFCKSPCLEKLVTKDGRSLTCPTCRHIVPLSDKGVAGLQSDFHVDHLFEIRDAFDKAAESSKTQCGNCEERKATGYCRDCRDFLCNNCQAAHQALKLTRSHQIVSRQEFQEQATNISTAKKTIPTCGKHGNQLKIYCDTCKELICTDCTIRLHKDHNYDLVADVFPRHKEDFVSSLKPVKEKLDKVQQALKDFDTLAKYIHNQRATLEAEIHKEIDEQHLLLDQRRTELVGELEMMTQQKLKDLATQKDQVEITQVKLASCLEYAEVAFETGTECEVLEMKAPALKRIEQILTEFDQDTIQPEIDTKMKLITNGKEQLKKSCKSYLRIRDDKIRYSLKGENLAGVEVNMAMEFELQLKKEYQNVEVVAAVTQTPIKCEIIRRDNKYEITYTPTNRGKHKLDLTINGEHVKGSPFTVVAMSQPHTLGAPSRVISNLKRPSGVAISNSCHVIVAERGSGQILIYNGLYEQIQAFDSRGKAPVGVAVDKDDNIYISDRDNNKIRKFTANGDFLKEVGTKGDQRLQFNKPSGIGYDKTNDKIYVGDQYNNRIQVLNPDLTFHSIISDNEFKNPLDVSFDRTGNAYVVNWASHTVKVFQKNGKLPRTFGTYGSGPGQLSNPAAIAVSNTDTVYVVEMYGHRISVFKTNGEFICSFGNKGKKGGQFNDPTGIAIDDYGNIVVADRGNERLQVF